MIVPYALGCRPVTSGTRQVLVAEVWAGQERTCAHRCEQHDGDCPVTLGLSRAAAEIDGLEEGAYGHWLNELCSALQSASKKERETARDALARLQKLALTTSPAAKYEPDSEHAQTAISSLRTELAGLSNKELRQRAVTAEVEFDDIEEARESSNPKSQLIELIVAREATATLVHSERESEAARAALRREINNQGAIRENHYDMDCGDD